MSFDILGLWQQKIVSLQCLSPLLTSCQFDATKPTNAPDGMFGSKARPALGEEGETLQSMFIYYDLGPQGVPRGVDNIRVLGPI